MVNSFDKVFMGAAGTSIGGLPDDEFNRVSFLSHFDGANNGVNNAFDDGSASNHTITANGNVTQGSFGPFARPDGEWGVSFNGDRAGSVANYLDTPAGADFELDANYTIEGWFFQTVREEGSALFELNDYRSGILFRLGDASSIYDSWYINGTDYDSPASSFPLGQWNHFAMTRDGSTNRLFANGVQIATASVSGDINSPQGKLRIGGIQHTTGQQFVGAVSNFRLIKGTALYTSNFTPSTSKLTAVTNTKLLTCQSNRFVDNSASAHTLTPYGKTAVTAFGPFLTSSVYDAAVNGASAFFDGDNDSLTTGDSADFVLGDTFTLEAWVYPTVSESNDYPMIMSQAEGYPTGWYFSLRFTNEVNFYLNAADNAGGAIDLNTDGSDPVQLNAWNHIALSVSSGTGYIYVNGARKSSAATGINNNLDRSGTTFRVGIHNAAGSYDFDGYICDARVVKGTALYSGTTYTVPTAPLTAITNTKLLLNMADGQAIDSAAQNNLTLFGNAKISTGQAKFGNTSMLFDGNGDYALASDTTSFELGSGDWTIETFVWAVGVSNTPYILDARSSSTANEVVPTIYVQSSRLEFWVSNGARIQAGEDLSLNAWNHVAVCKSGSSTKLFINGSQSGSTYTDNNTYIKPTYVYIGMRSGTTSQSWNGYMDEFRVSKMARYTSNFTAPTEPFADKGQ